MIEKLKKDLAENYHDDDDNVIEDMIKNYTSIASSASNRKSNDKLLEPHIYTAVKSAYLRRGAEGFNSKSEGGLGSGFVDIEEKLKKDVLAIRKGNF